MQNAAMTDIQTSISLICQKISPDQTIEALPIHGKGEKMQFSRVTKNSERLKRVNH